MVEELNSVQAACLALEPEGTYKPAITYIIVGKRHHTRMFCQNANDAMKNKGMNVPPGTITDKDICHYSEMDRYLCSHGGIQVLTSILDIDLLTDLTDLSFLSLFFLSSLFLSSLFSLLSSLFSLLSLLSLSSLSH
jgi:Piwi domain